MPYYTFLNEKTQEYRDVFFHMNDDKVYNGENGDEVGIWRRIFSVPQLNIDVAADPFDVNSFVSNSTKYSKLGDALDKSKELSEKRKEMSGGVDPVKENYYRNYEKKTGKKHIKEKQEKSAKKVSVNGVNVEF